MALFSVDCYQQYDQIINIHFNTFWVHTLHHALLVYKHFIDQQAHIKTDIAAFLQVCIIILYDYTNPQAVVFYAYPDMIDNTNCTISNHSINELSSLLFKQYIIIVRTTVHHYGNQLYQLVHASEHKIVKAEGVSKKQQQ